jgi:hypothetical protein
MATPEVVKVVDKRHSAIELQPLNAEVQAGTTIPLSITPMGMVEIAVRRGANIDELSKLLDLQERWEKREAEKAFVAALAAFKKNPPEIIKNKKVSYTNKQGQLVEYKHATLDRVTGVIAAGLGEHGISADWETAQENGRIRVSCFLQHERGHREKRASLEGPPDDSGAKSNVQAIASTVTFLERYTLLAATGLATRDDADGITFADVEDAIASLNSAITLDELQDRFNKAYKRAHAAKDKASMGIIIETKDERKKALLTKNPKAEEQQKEFEKLAEAAGLNTAARNMLIGKHQGNLEAAIAEIKEVASKTPADDGPKESKRSAKGKGGSKSGTEPAGTGQSHAAEPPSAPKEGDLGF